MIAVCKKELRSYLTGLTGALMVAVILAVIFLYFIFNNLIAMSADIAAPMNAACILSLTFAVPFLTMRSFAEEKSKRTDQLLLTSPLKLSSIVFGKFLALAVLLLIPVFFACLLPLILSPYGEVQYLYCYTAILAFYLYALMITAIGLFISSLTSAPFVAGIITFLVTLLGVVLGSAYGSIGIAPLRTLLRAAFDFNARISALMSGLFDCSAVIYFLSMTVLFLVLTVLSLRLRRHSFQKGERNPQGLKIVLSAVIAVAVTVTLNLIAAQLPDRVRSFDVTKSRLYSITAQSKEAVKDLADDYTLYLLAPEGEGDGKDTNIERVLQSYAASSDHITLTYINTVIQPQFYADYADDPLNLNSVVVKNETTGTYRTFDYLELIQTELDVSSLQQYVTGYDVEGQVTGALQALSGDASLLDNAYLLTGHGERSFEDMYLRLFSRMGYTLSELQLTTSPQVPEDAVLLILNAPVRDYTKDEADKILDYLSDGGNLLVITDYQAEQSMPQFDRILDYYQVSLQRGLVIERDPEGYYYSGTFAAPFYIYPLIVPDDVTEGLTDALSGSVFVPMTESFDCAEGNAITHTALLITSEDAFLKTDLSNENLTPEAGDLTGRQILGLKSVRVTEKEDRSIAIFYGSEQLFTTAADEQYAIGMNARLFGNTLSALSSADEGRVTIPVKRFYNNLSVRASSMIAWSVTLILVIPLIIVFGLIIYLYRRRL